MLRRIILTLVCAVWRGEASANPGGMSVAAGSASAHNSGKQLTITAGNGAVLHWNSFNIGPGETTAFIQPSANSIVLNTIGGTVPSQIWGHLTANGTVILASPFGFYFGPDSMIKVGGHFIATTAPLPPDASSGASWRFTLPPPSASIVNYGEIHVGQGRSLFLIAEQIENHGTLNAPGGNVGLYAGKEVLVTDRADGRGLSAKVVLPQGSIDNSGSIVASPGDLALNEQVVNKTTVNQANAVQVKDGAIELVATDITLGANTANGAVNVTSAFSGASSISLKASDNITLNANTTWDLKKSTGNTSGQLTLTAGNDIIFKSGSQITDANNWSLSLSAGGNISLAGTSVIQTSAGAIVMTAGQDITVGGGAIRTLGGGSINLKATGDINAGTKADGYIFDVAGYSAVATAGQIATVAGGNVTLAAGDNITSLPGNVPTGQWPGATGAYGAGDVSLAAGNQVIGNYTLANGTGSISAADIGLSTHPLVLNLIKGAWNLTATGDVFLGEIRNPNGAFGANNLTVPTGKYLGNIGASVPPRSQFLFDYAPDAAANIAAGDSITLVGANLLRASDNQHMPPVYPPSLSLTAGAAGVTVGNSIILFPSAKGSLAITSLGKLSGQTQQSTLTGITMSDSGLPGWSTFADGHAVRPLHLHDSKPVKLTIAGDIDSFGLTIPTYADIVVGGNTYNFGLLGQNLSPKQTTQIAVAGDIKYRGDFTSVTLTAPLPAAVFDVIDSGDPSAARKISYDPVSGHLTFIGQMSPSDEAFLLKPFSVFVDPVSGASWNVPIFLSKSQKSAIQSLFIASQSASLGDQGLAVSGPGTFKVTARNIDLGISGGISVLAPNSALAAIAKRGASLDIHVAGNLEMTASRIANEGYLGAIQLTAGGALNVGGELTAFGDPNSPKGIFTTSGGGVTVQAAGDVNVNGSRIAAYDGGNVAVQSLHGDINAGIGGSGYVSLQSLYLDPWGNLVAIPATIPGSGILATTVPGSPAWAGNITLNAPRGNVQAGAGGIILIPYNGSDIGGELTINAKYDVNSAGSGIINLGAGSTFVTAGNITGLVVTRGHARLSARGNVNATVYAGAGANVSAGGTVSGAVISGGAVDVSGDAITASLLGQSVSTAGNATSAAIGIAAPNVSTESAKNTEDFSKSIAKTTDEPSDDDQKKNKKTIMLAQKSGRVTVLLPARKP